MSDGLPPTDIDIAGRLAGAEEEKQQEQPKRLGDLYQKPSRYEGKDPVLQSWYRDALDKRFYRPHFFPQPAPGITQGQPPAAQNYRQVDESVLDVAKNLTSELSAGAMQAIMGDFIDDPSLLTLFDEEEEQQWLDWHNEISAVSQEMSLVAGAHSPFEPEEVISQPPGMKVLASPPDPDDPDFDPTEEWKYFDEKSGQLAEQNQFGESLPPNAIGWDANGRPFYGTGIEGYNNQIAGMLGEANDKNWGWQRQQRETWWETAGATVGNWLKNNILGVGARMVFRSTIGAAIRLAEGTEREIGTLSLAAEQLIDEASYRRYDEVFAEQEIASLRGGQPISEAGFVTEQGADLEPYRGQAGIRITDKALNSVIERM